MADTVCFEELPEGTTFWMPSSGAKCVKVIGATDDDGIYYDFVSMESDFYGCMSADAVVRRKPLPQEE